MSREFHGREKKVQKMTKDGLVEKNLSTGEEQRISMRGQDFDLKKEQPDAGGRGGDHSEPAGRQHRQQAPPDREPDTSRTSSVTSEESRFSSSADDFRSTEQQNTPHRQSRRAQDFSERPAHSMPEDGSQTIPDVAAPLETARASDAPPSAAADGGRLPVSDTRASRAPDRPGRLRTEQSADSSAPSSSPKQRGTKYSQRFAQEAAGTASEGDGTQVAEPANAPTTASPAKSSRLQFDKNELPPGADAPADKKLRSAQHKADATGEKLERAREKLPTKKQIKVQRVYDEQKKKAKTKFQFEDAPRAPGEKLFKPPAIVSKPAAAVKGAAGAAALSARGKFHQKIHQVEDENVGVKAGHRAEMAGEAGLRMGKRAVGKTYRFVRDKPYRTVAKLEKEAMKANVKLSYRKALAENPQLKSNVISRFMQKRKIQRQYAKALRDAKKAGETAKKTGTVIGRAAKAVAGFVRRHPLGVGIVALILLLVFFLMSALGSCSNMASGVMSGVVTSSYVAEDADIDNAELAYTEWETDLQMRVNSAESDYPNYDEYRYNVDDISHDPFELIAYLTAVYQDFTYAEVQAVLQQIFEEQYQLTFTPEVEIRYRTETHTDPETGEDYDVEVPYEWHILNITLTARSFSEVVSSRMSTDQAEMFEVYMQTKGNRQYLINPFGFNWLPYVSSYYGWRVHPISGEKDYHKGIDIAVAQGTEILAGHDGVVTQAGDAGGYGLVVVIEGDKGLVSKYAHCSELLVSAGQEVKKGDVIAKVGSTGNSTGPHLHLEILKNGQYLNPIFFGETGDDGSGRIPPGSPGGVEFPDYPGAPMGDGSYAALMEEAQKHLGKPYVFGAKGPDKFDCSGFVSWSLTHSGVKSIQTNAQGLYNACTPVADPQPGDLIFFHSTYSTSNTVTHVGIYIGNGQMIHAGKPVQYASIDTRYWREHFYAFGRI